MSIKSLLSRVYLGGDSRKDQPAPALKFRIWSVNSWLRYTGARIYVEHDGEDFTCIGIMWVGPPGSKGWRRMEGKS